jgi:exodeoxyribonuclease VII small subunit
MKSFEERLSRLEEINQEIREGDTPLEKAAELFEEGVALSRGLDKDLEQIERRVEKLTNTPTEPGEKPALELFPELEKLSESESD